MTEDHLSPTGESPERRTADRQISVLINAGIIHQDRDSLCRIRNLSTGGAMIESSLPLAIDDKVLLCLRSGQQVEGQVRWTRDDRAGLAFDDPNAAALVRGTGEAVRRPPPSPIGYPLFRRQSGVRISAGHKSERAALTMISPTGMVVESSRDWGNEQLFTVTLEGLGSHVARRTNDALCEDEAMALILGQPLHYRAFTEWLDADGNALSDVPFDGGSRWTVRHESAVQDSL